MSQSHTAADGDTADANPHSGIVWIYHFQPDGSAELVPNERVEEALANHVGWTWVHLSLADTRCRLWIAQNERLSELARETLLGPDEHLRLDVLGHEIVGVVPDLQQEFSQAGEALVRLRFAMTERMLISARRTPVHSVEINRRAIESGKRFPSAVSLLDAMVDHFADAVGRMAERLAAELDGSRGSRDAGRAGQRAAPHRPRAPAGGARAPAVGAVARHVPPPRAAHGGRSRADGGRDPPRWRRSSTPSTTRSPRCTTARGSCSTRSR